MTKDKYNLFGRLTTTVEVPRRLGVFKPRVPEAVQPVPCVLPNFESVSIRLPVVLNSTPTDSGFVKPKVDSILSVAPLILAPKLTPKLKIPKSKVPEPKFDKPEDKHNARVRDFIKSFF